VYQVQDTAALARGHRSLLRRRGVGGRVGRTVLLLGIVSLLTDISSEMVATVLPLYLLYTVGLSPLQYGFVDGVYQAGAALVRIAGGFVGDRWRRHKEVAAVGYGISAFCKPALIAVGGAWSALLGVILVDRAGKGIRTAPRDALISLSTPKEHLGTAFGVHRALDTTGAMLGPLVAFALLLWTPTAFDSVFFVSFCFGLVGLAVLLLFVKNPPEQPAAVEIESLPRRESRLRLLAERRFLALGLAGTVLGVATMSDGFVYLGLQRKLDFEPGMFPLLFVATASVYMLLAVPVGRLADRVGRTKVFLAGYSLLLPVYGVLVLSGVGLGGVVLCTVLLGTFYAATDGVLAAMASALLPPEVRGTGLATLVTATSTGRLVASVLFGTLWTAFGYETAVMAFAGVLIVALATAAPILTVMRRQASHA
jgi:MFS family permease